MLTVKDLLDLEVFDSYKILSSKNNLNKIVESSSFIEVPDYSNYLIPNSILITTLINFKENSNFLYNFILDSSSYKISAIVIKDKGLFTFTEEIISLANKLGMVIILLDYDCNLSHVLSRISNIIHSSQTTSGEYSIQNMYFSDMLSKVETYEDLISEIKKIHIYELYIEMKDGNSLSTCKKFSEKIKKNKELRNKNFSILNNYLIIKKEIICNDQIYCNIYMSIPIDYKDQAFYISEYINIIILSIKSNYDRKILDNEVKLKNFLKNINIASKYENESRFCYNTLNFPIVILFFKNTSHIDSDCNNIDYIYNEISTFFEISISEIYLFYTKKYTIFIFNVNNHRVYEQNFYMFISKIFTNIDKNFSQIYSSKIIYSGIDLEMLYMDSLSLISILDNISNLKPGIYLGEFDTLNLLKYIDEKILLSFMKDKLRGLFKHENTNNELIETLNTLILTNFQLKICASRLFIHYNTLRYRLSLLDNLGFDIRSINFNSTDVSIAISIYYFIFLPKYTNNLK